MSGTGALFPIIGSVAKENTKEFICATIDTVNVQATEFEMVPFGGAGKDKSFSIDTTRTAFNLTNFGTAALKDRWLSGDGRTPHSGKLTLGVFFLDGSSSQQAIFRDAANVWVEKLGGKLAFDYSAPQGGSQIRVTFNTGVNESYIGRGNLLVKNSSPTMRIGDVVPHIIQHECGHALGLQHEHQNPKVPFTWNKAKVIADMKAQGWSEEQTVANIIDRYSQNLACVGDPDFNDKSIMLYPIPASWTNFSFSSGENSLITIRDVKCASSLLDKK
ncbi:hypothetical protein [Methylobacterium sp.]|uniref:hypothetical protein n=1 Tax=Methylobacterium sp. TaxID=409 RepID=UPI003C78B559